MANQQGLIRVNLTLPPEVVAVLDRMGKVTGAGRATIVREFLCDGLPMFEQAAAALEAAQLGNRRALDLVGDVVQAMAADVAGQAVDLRTVIRGRRAARIKRVPRD